MRITSQSFAFIRASLLLSSASSPASPVGTPPAAGVPGRSHPEKTRRDDPLSGLRLVGLPHGQTVDSVAAFLPGRFREDAGGQASVVLHDKRCGSSQTQWDGAAEDKGGCGFQADDEAQ